MQKVRWAVIGAGGIARRRTIPEGIVPAHNAELIAVYAPNSGAEVAQQFGVIAAQTEDALFETACDAIYVASPVTCHLSQVIRAAQAGKHVLCEKPLALNVAEAEEMVRGCAESSVKLGVALMMRGHPLHRKACELVEGGCIGKPTYARAQLSCWYPPLKNAWRQDPQQGGGGALPDLVPHCVDLLEMILGQKIVSVMATVDTLVHDYPVDDTAVLAFRFDGGAVATVDCLFNVPDQASPNRLEVYGSAGAVLAEGTIGQTTAGTMKWFEQKSQAAYDATQTHAQVNDWQVADYAPTNMYQTQIEEFSAAILEESVVPASASQGLWIQRVLAACQESAATDRRISISNQ